MKITGYADTLSAAPGETISFMVNCELPRYRVEVVRIICGDTNPAGPGVKEEVVKTPVSKTYTGRRQTIEAGSYITIPTRPPLEEFDSFSFQAFIWPTTPTKGRQVIAARFRDRTRPASPWSSPNTTPRWPSSWVTARVTRKSWPPSGRCSTARGILSPRAMTSGRAGCVCTRSR